MRMRMRMIKRMRIKKKKSGCERTWEREREGKRVHNLPVQIHLEYHHYQNVLHLRPSYIET